MNKDLRETFESVEKFFYKAIERDKQQKKQIEELENKLKNVFKLIGKDEEITYTCKNCDRSSVCGNYPLFKEIVTRNQLRAELRKELNK